MHSFPAVDLEKLARGQRVAGDVFRAVFADAAAVADLSRLLQVRDLLRGAESDGWPPANVPPMDVTWEELARHGEGQPLEPARWAAVDHFLGKHFPEASAPPAEVDTRLDFPTGQDTRVEFRPENG
jgi:hypothetical protein